MRSSTRKVLSVESELGSFLHRSSRSERSAFVGFVALNLHGFYSGWERLFELIARHVDGVAPSGDTWHRDLLHRMATDQPDVRPAVLGPASVKDLDELRRFRHLVRNLYTFNYDPEKLGTLLQALPRIWETARAELLAFAGFLDDLAQAD